MLRTVLKFLYIRRCASICTCAVVDNAPGGYGIRLYVFVLALGSKLHIFYYLLSIIFYLN